MVSGLLLSGLLLIDDIEIRVLPVASRVFASDLEPKVDLAFQPLKVSHRDVVRRYQTR